MSSKAEPDTMAWEIVSWVILVGLLLVVLRAWVSPNDSACNFEGVRQAVPWMCERWDG